MPKPFFIVGPTAVGKSRLAVEVAARCGAEIVGADAFQVYRGFDLLTAKPTAAEHARVPHHLVGTVSPAETYHVARYLEDARGCLATLASRARPALIAGGSGLYVKAVTHGLSPLPAADWTIRADLERLETATLVSRLLSVDPVAAGTIDRANRRRLIRALEVCQLTGEPFSRQQNSWAQQSPEAAHTGVLLVRAKEDLNARIQRRVEAMFTHGVLEEARAAASLTLSPTASKMIGLGQIQDHLAGRTTLRQCQEQIVTATRQYAKRQRTWFHREKSFEVVDLTTRSDESQLIDHLCHRFESNLQNE